MTFRHIIALGLAVETAALVRAIQYYRRNPNG